MLEMWVKMVCWKRKTWVTRAFILFIEEKINWWGLLMESSLWIIFNFPESFKSVYMECPNSRVSWGWILLRLWKSLFLGAGRWGLLVAFTGWSLLSRGERIRWLSQLKAHPKFRQHWACVWEGVSSFSGCSDRIEISGALVLWPAVAWLIICQENKECVR